MSSRCPIFQLLNSMARLGFGTLDQIMSHQLVCILVCAVQVFVTFPGPISGAAEAETEMASSTDEAASDGGDVRSERGKKSYMAETRQCLVLARQSLPRDVYDEFVKTMTEIWKRRYVRFSDCIAS